jgi:hypothetical protein
MRPLSKVILVLGGGLLVAGPVALLVPRKAPPAQTATVDLPTAPRPASVPRFVPAPGEAAPSGPAAVASSEELMSAPPAHDPALPAQQLARRKRDLGQMLDEMAGKLQADLAATADPEARRVAELRLERMRRQAERLRGGGG